MESKYQITDTDWGLITQLQRDTKIIEKLFKDYKESQDTLRFYGDISTKSYAKGEKPSPEIRELIQVFMEITQNEYNDYNNALADWNKKMEFLVLKYNYKTLRQFAAKLSSNLSETKPSLTFATNIKLIAQTLEIPVFQFLLSGKPSYVNLYPENWLEKVYSKIEFHSNNNNLNILNFSDLI